MVRPYTLTIGSWYDGQGPTNVNCSARMLGWWLNDAFAALPHVTVRRISAPEELTEPCDFLLLHTYVDTVLEKAFSALRARARFGSINFLEVVLPGADLQVLFLPQVANCLYVKLPLAKDVLRPFTVPKRPRSVLLDHVWLGFLHTEQEWTARLYSWLAELGQTGDTAQIGHLWTEWARLGLQTPSWVHHISDSILTYYDYLQATAAYETFIVTHRGSYNHSVLDMAARGIRVLVPYSSSLGPFVPDAVIRELELPTFRTCAELGALLAQPVNRTFWDSRMACCTDMNAVAAQIDAWCQRRLVGDSSGD